MAFIGVILIATSIAFAGLLSVCPALVVAWSYRLRALNGATGGMFWGTGLITWSLCTVVIATGLVMINGADMSWIMVGGPPATWTARVSKLCMDLLWSPIFLLGILLLNAGTHVSLGRLLKTRLTEASHLPSSASNATKDQSDY